MKDFTAALLVALSLVFTGCATQTPQKYLSGYGIQAPQLNDFETCSTIGCRRTSELSYNTEEWQQIADCFLPLAEDAASEREQIREAIALMERINGPKNDTYRDNPRNKIIGAKGNQLDCIAEAVNTTVGLLLLQQEGLIRFHTVGYPQHRGFAQIKLPHNTASIFEKSTGKHYVVDSWYGANGELPDVMLTEEWKGGLL